MDEEARKILSEVLGIPATEICEALAINTVPQWDSASHIGLMLELESRWRIEITENVIIQCATFRGLSAFIGSLDEGGAFAENQTT
jgi:acyl carrier protein